MLTKLVQRYPSFDNAITHTKNIGIPLRLKAEVSHGTAPLSNRIR